MIPAGPLPPTPQGGLRTRMEHKIPPGGLESFRDGGIKTKELKLRKIKHYNEEKRFHDSCGG